MSRWSSGSKVLSATGNAMRMIFAGSAASAPWTAPMRIHASTAPNACREDLTRIGKRMYTRDRLRRSAGPLIPGLALQHDIHVKVAQVEQHDRMLAVADHPGMRHERFDTV